MIDREEWEKIKQSFVDEYGWAHTSQTVIGHLSPYGVIHLPGKHVSWVCPVDQRRVDELLEAGKARLCQTCFGEKRKRCSHCAKFIKDGEKCSFCKKK